MAVGVGCCGGGSQSSGDVLRQSASLMCMACVPPSTNGSGAAPRNPNSSRKLPHRRRRAVLAPASPIEVARRARQRGRSIPGSPRGARGLHGAPLLRRRCPGGRLLGKGGLKVRAGHGSRKLMAHVLAAARRCGNDLRHAVCGLRWTLRSRRGTRTGRWGAGSRRCARRGEAKAELRR